MLVHELQEELKKRVQQEENYKNILKTYFTDKSQIMQLQDQFDRLKQKYFFSVGVSVKLNQTLQGKPSTVNISQLFEQAQLNNVPFDQYDSWINKHF